MKHKPEHQAERKLLLECDSKLVAAAALDIEELLGLDGYQVYTRPDVTVDREHGLLHIRVNCTRKLVLE